MNKEAIEGTEEMVMYLEQERPRDVLRLSLAIERRKRTARPERSPRAMCLGVG